MQPFQEDLYYDKLHILFKTAFFSTDDNNAINNKKK